MNHSKEIAALLNEREGYLRRGLAKRVADVDAALAALGHKTQARAEAATIEPEAERAALPKARKHKQ
jgi:hypothetical protein